MATPLATLLTGLRTDPMMRSAFAEQPAEFLTDHGWDELDPTDMAEAMLVLADATPPAEAAQWAQGADVVGAADGAGALATAEGLSAALPLIGDEPDALDVDDGVDATSDVTDSTADDRREDESDLEGPGADGDDARDGTDDETDGVHEELEGLDAPDLTHGHVHDDVFDLDSPTATERSDAGGDSQTPDAAAEPVEAAFGTGVDTTVPLADEPSTAGPGGTAHDAAIGTPSPDDPAIGDPELAVPATGAETDTDADASTSADDDAPIDLDTGGLEPDQPIEQFADALGEHDQPGDTEVHTDDGWDEMI